MKGKNFANKNIMLTIMLLIVLSFIGGIVDFACSKEVPTGNLIIAVGELRLQNQDPIINLNAGKLFLSVMYDSLVGLNEDESKLSTETGLAYKWEISPDSKHLTFWLREGVKFHNDDEVTAEDVKFSLERIIGPKSRDEYMIIMKNMQEIRVISPYKLEITLKTPNSRFIHFLSPSQGISGYIVPKKYIEKMGDNYFNQHPIGSGPYKFESQVMDSYIRYEAVDYPHWRVGVPKFKYLTFKEVSEVGTRVALLKRGEADIISISRARIKDLKEAGFRVFAKKAGRNLSFYVPEQWREGNPLGSRKVRQALNLAINRDDIIKHILSGTGTPVGLWASGSWALYWPDIPGYTYDPNRARQLLAEAGYPNGFDLNVLTYKVSSAPEAEEVVQAVAGYWNVIGVKPHIVLTDYSSAKAKLKAFKLVVPTVFPHACGNRLLGEDVPMQVYHSKSGYQLVRDPEMDSKLETAAYAKTEEKYRKSIVELLWYLHDEFKAIPICTLDELYGVSQKVVADWNIGKAYASMNLEWLYRR